MNFIKTYWLGLMLLLLSVTIGLATYKDYGIGTDEYDQRTIGQRCYSYVFNNDTTYYTYIERDHGTGFELPLVIIEKQLQLTDTRDIYLMRHLVTHLFFIICLFAGYIMAYKLFNNQALACLAYIALVYHPRLYGHSFVNTKDIPAMATVLLSIAFIATALMGQKRWQWLLCGFICAYSVSIRLMNIIVIMPVILFFLIDLVNAAGTRRKTIFSLLAFVLAFCTCLYTCWPTLWTDPVVNFIDAYHSLSHFRWDGNVLLSGNIISARQLPWYYIITWFSITTPVVWLVIGFIGIVLIIWRAAKQPIPFFTDSRKRILLLCLFCFIVPLVIVVLLHAVMYDDWRHLYFIYPAFVILLIYALNSIKNKKLYLIAFSLCIIQFIAASMFMVYDHPYQNVYFNELVTHEKDAMHTQYELDYWGTAGRQGLEWILANDTSANIVVNSTAVMRYNLMILSPQQRSRISLSVDESAMNYYVESFRTIPYFYADSQSCYNVVAGNNSILRIVKLR